MKLIIAIIQPSRLEAVKAALSEVEVFRLTIMDVQGFGRQKGHAEVFRGHEVAVNLLRKVQLQLADWTFSPSGTEGFAKAEVTVKIGAKLKASVWMVAAGLLGMIAALLVIQAIVFAIASFGLALHWSCLLVAAVLAAGGAAAFYHGRSLAEEQLLPERSIKQITRDIETAKEQLT